MRVCRGGGEHLKYRLELPHTLTVYEAGVDAAVTAVAGATTCSASVSRCLAGAVSLADFPVFIRQHLMRPVDALLPIVYNCLSPFAGKSY